MAMAADEMIIEHAHRLRESIDDRRPTKIKAALFEILADFDCEWRLRLHITHFAQIILDRRADPK